MCKFAISVFLYSLLIGLFGGQLVSADEFELNEVESLPDFSDIANPLSKISAISVKQSSVFSSQEVRISYFENLEDALSEINAISNQMSPQYSFDFLTPEIRSVNDELKFFIWNPNGANFEIDNFIVRKFEHK